VRQNQLKEEHPVEQNEADSLSESEPDDSPSTDMPEHMLAQQREGVRISHPGLIDQVSTTPETAQISTTPEWREEPQVYWNWSQDEPEVRLLRPGDSRLEWTRRGMNGSTATNWRDLLKRDDVAPPGGSECSICLDGMEQSQEKAGGQADDLIGLNCGHKFHANCLQVWFTQQLSRHPAIMSCPVCRKPLGLPEGIIKASD